MANLSNINGKFVVEQTTGYVGVGTTDPNYPIEVLNASAEIALNASGGSIYRLRSDSTDSFRINKNGVGDRLVINSAGNATFAGDVYTTGTSNSFVVISRDNMYVDAGQLYIGADDGTTDDSFRQRVTSGSYFIESRKSGTWTNRLQINTAGTLIVQQGMAISGNIDGVGATFIGTAASGAALVTIENNSGSTATSYGLLVKGGGNSASGKTFEVRDDSGNTDLIVKGNGNVGINTNSPSAKLSVVGSGENGGIFFGNSGAQEHRFYASANSQFNTIGSSTPIWNWAQYTGVGVTPNYKMTLNSTGLGIGTTSPTTPLEVNGIVRIDTSGNTAFYEGDGVRLFGSQNYRFRNTSGNVRAIINVTSGNFSLYNASNNITNLIATAGDSYFNGGNVGIGETSPDQKLNVREDGGSDVFRGIEVHNNNQSQARAGICFKAYDWVQSAIWHGRGTSTAYNGALVLGTNPNTTDLTVSGVTGRMWILNNGNIGIRTDAPTNPLNINFSPNGIANITTGNNSTAWNTSSAIMLNGASNSNGLGFGVSGTANDRKSWIQSGHPQQQYANYLGALAINPLGGDVGIGTTSPTAKLDINGTVRYRGNTYSQLTYQVSGNYSANTWYTIATTATLTEQGIYILVAYVEDFTAGGSNYYIHACSTNFFWDRTSTNRTTAFNFPALLGTGHATGSLPLIRITQELGTAGAQSKIQWQTPYTYTGLNPGLSGKKLVFYFKRIGG